jgi:ribosomal-protein-alanine N-acetyltransferase
MSRSPITAASKLWSLRRVACDDVDALHALCCKPEVYRYLFDGSPPERAFIAADVERSLADFDRLGVGMLVLQGPDRRPAGSVGLKPDAAGRSVELIYLLDPALWGGGLATRMAWTAMELAFQTGNIESVRAGADGPNARSFALMRRLGMSFRGEAVYPLGPGREYIRYRGDPAPSPPPERLPVAG